MKVLRSLSAAFTTYSKFPVPQVEWTADSMAWALCCFPVVGIAIGLCLFVWLWAASALGLGTALTAAGALLLPIFLSGGIHLDGLCDTADALGSHQSRERKLEILKDSHIGAFGVITCVLYLIVFFAVWSEVLPVDIKTMSAVALIPVLSRSLSGMMAVTQPNARGSGLLATFTAPMDLSKARVLLAIWILLVVVVIGVVGVMYAIAVVIAAALVLLYYIVMSRRQFGGITGDLAGFFLQLCELVCVLAIAIAPTVWEVLQQWF